MPILPLFVTSGAAPVGSATLGEAIATYWSNQGLATSVGTFYHVEIERMSNNRAAYEAQCCVLVDQGATSVNVGKNKRGHDRLRRQFVVVGTDPLTIQAACREIFDMFNRLLPTELPIQTDAGNLIGCRPLSPREAQVTKNRLPLPSNKTLLNASVEVQFILTRGEAP